MADPFSLGMNIYTAFKEVYLVARFMHRAALSAKNHVAERRELREDFEGEVLFLQSLGNLYLRSNGIINDPDMDKRWLQQICTILERMRYYCTDYARVAEEDDEYYKRYSPYLNEAMFNTLTIEFDINEPLPSAATPRIFSMNALRWFGIKSSQKLSEGIDSWKWALIEKKKFEHVLVNFRKQNKRLKEILPLFTAAKLTQFQDVQNRQAPARRKSISEDADARRLGIAPHARLREISYDPVSSDSEFLLQNFALHSPLDVYTIAVGSLTPTPVKRQAPVEKVLVEYKEYHHPEPPDLYEIEAYQQRMRQLTRLLATAGKNQLHTLPLRGVLDRKEEQRYAFLFKFPEDGDTSIDPVSLYSMISKNDLKSRLNLGQRFQVARIVAKSIGAFHADGWVHKSIRSDSIVFFHKQLEVSKQKSSSTDLKSTLVVDDPYLVNFEFSRPETAQTKLDFDDDLARNLYRHPDRQGPPKTSFSKLHDIYSLGIVLLEIGVWQTAPSIFAQAGINPDSQPSPVMIQKIFVQVAKKRLAHHMGTAYLEAVLACIAGKFTDRTSRADFPMVFHEDVVQNLELVI